MVSKRLREERERLGFVSRDELSEKTGIPERTITNYEYKDQSPSIKSWLAFLRVGIDIGYVLTGVRTPEGHLLKMREGSDSEKPLPKIRKDTPYQLIQAVKKDLDKLYIMFENERKEGRCSLCLYWEQHSEDIGICNAPVPTHLKFAVGQTASNDGIECEMFCGF